MKSERIFTTSASNQTSFHGTSPRRWASPAPSSSGPPSVQFEVIHSFWEPTYSPRLIRHVILTPVSNFLFQVFRGQSTCFTNDGSCLEDHGMWVAHGATHMHTSQPPPPPTGLQRVIRTPPPLLLQLFRRWGWHFERKKRRMGPKKWSLIFLNDEEAPV